MPDYLPDVYLRFRELYPQVAETLDGLGAATESAGPLDHRTQRLAKLDRSTRTYKIIRLQRPQGAGRRRHPRRGSPRGSPRHHHHRLPHRSGQPRLD